MPPSEVEPLSDGPAAMQPGDECWVLRRDGSWDRCVVRYIDHGADGQSAPLVGVESLTLMSPVGGMDHWRPLDLEAMAALRAAVDAVAKARDAVVYAAQQWAKVHWDAGSEVTLRKCVAELAVATIAEAEARARLEALR